MDLHLTDLDALCLNVRHPLTRSYIDESIKAYRAGSYKASIVSIWVAVTFDIIAKIRDLADQGEAAATTFITTFDKNVGSNNVKKLLEIEAELLDKAEKDFEFIDPISRRHFERLQQDRNLCAHPAFTADGQLFAPEPELVRLYLVEAIRNLLSRRPVRGKTIIDQFDRDFKSHSFPAKPEEVTKFVVSRYLNNSRVAVHISFAKVLAKAMLKQAPPGWDAKINLLPSVLQAVKDCGPAAWSTAVLPAIMSLIETADDEHLLNAYSLMRRFDDVLVALDGPATARLGALIHNLPPDAADVRIFEAAALPAFATMAQTKFAAAGSVVQAAVLARFPFRPFWEAACRALTEANSFRGAESLFRSFIVPFRGTATPDQLVELLAVVVSNLQIFAAAGIPGELAAFADAVGQRNSLHAGQLAAFLAYLDRRTLGGRDTFSGVLDVFAAAGVTIPAAPAAL